MAVKVEIYGTSNCKKCVDVRHLLDQKQVDYIDHLIDLMPLEKDEMIRRINDEHVGGEEELMALEAEGELDRLLGLERQGL